MRSREELPGVWGAERADSGGGNWGGPPWPGNLRSQADRARHADRGNRRRDTRRQASPHDSDPDGPDGTAHDPATDPLPALDRLDEVPGISRRGAQIILAEIGLDMSRFPTAGHLVSWAKLCPASIQSGVTTKSGKTGNGDPYLKGVLSEIATAAE